MATEGRSSQPDPMADSEAYLVEKLEGMKRQVKVMEEAIEKLRIGRAQEAPLGDFPPVKSTDYRGMRAIDALEAYLKTRRGAKVQLSKAVYDLVQGGVDPGRPRWSNKEPEFLVAQTLKIGLANNPKLFDWTPQDVSKKTGITIVKKGASNDEIYIWLAKDADEPRRRAR